MLGGRDEKNNVKSQLYLYKKRYQYVSLLKGLLYLGIVASITLLLFAGAEYLFRLNSTSRAVLFFTYSSGLLVGLIVWVAIPFYKWLMADKYLSDEDAARQIGEYFPEIGDKFVNLIQLENATQKDSTLLVASIQQKRQEIVPFKFSLAVNYSAIMQYVKVATIPLVVIVFLLLVFPEFIQESTGRIVQFNKEFKVPLPFKLELMDNNAIAYKNEDYDFKVNFSGEKLPNESYILFKGEKFFLTKELQLFSYRFKKPQSDLEFELFAGGYRVDNFKVKVVNRPVLENMKILIKPPKYLGQPSFYAQGTGNILVPEGSIVEWALTCNHTDSCFLEYDGKQKTVSANKKLIEYQETIYNDRQYKIKLKNAFGFAKDEISFSARVIKDEMPQLKAEDFLDSNRFDLLFINGEISDDHGFSSFNLHYTISKKNGEKSTGKKQIPFSQKSLLQDFLFKFPISQLDVAPGEHLTYYIELCDNDLVNGFKCVRSEVKRIEIPKKQEIEKLLEKSNKDLEAKAESILKQSQSLLKEISETEKKLKSKPKLDWNDRKDVSDLLKKNERLLNELEELKEIQNKLNEFEDKFLEFSPELLDKIDQLNQLMKEVLDPETQKLLEELEKLLEENKQDDQIKNSLDKLKNKNEALNNELDRAMELYKNLQMDKQLEQAIKELNELSLEQKKISEQEENKENIAEMQNSINEKFEDISKKLDDINELNNSLDQKRTLGNLDQDKEGINEELNNSKNDLDKGKTKNAKKSQKKASDMMQELTIKLQQAMDEDNSSRLAENIEDLENILNNLLKLSFDLEDLMKQFKVINQGDPRYVTLAQKQLKISDDAKLLEDSLIALSKRVFEIQSFVTREVSELRIQIEESTEMIKQRKPGNASARQQFSMTSANNLALLLDDVLKNMQEQMEMMNSKECKSGKSGKKPNPNGKPKPGDMGKMQQELNEQLQKLKEKGKNGKGLSEELARMAAQQEMLRQALKQLEKMMKDKGKLPEGGIGDMESLMEETEKDMVNKRITEETILRQKEILTRLLEAENALKERELSEEREGERPNDKEERIPPALKEYLRNKEKGTDYIKRVDPNLKPFYKNQVKEYLKTLSN